jgi:rhamnose transport system permease protein
MRANELPSGEPAPVGRLTLTHEVALALLLAAEVALFSFVGRNFLSGDNARDILRQAVEVGLLAVALTPVIVSGGIDLSVGSAAGLSAVVMGKLWQDAGLPIPAAAAAALITGVCAGALNAAMIVRLRLPPLIVTLGTLALFRGLAEVLTGGGGEFSGLPAGFKLLGTGEYFGVPAQLPVFASVAVGFWLLLHRTTIGRGLYAIGLSPEGARYAGIPVGRRLALVYVQSGAAAALAGIIYLAHQGQAKSDVGAGDELTAITAVVLGGTSIFGGRGTVHGTLFGLFAIVVLQRGLQLTDQGTELAGIMTGVMLLGAIGAGRLLDGAARKRTAHQVEGEFDVKNSQVAVLGGVILAGALIVAGSNWLLLRGMRPAGAEGQGKPGAESGRRLTIAMMPKSKGNSYFIACRKGAEEAAKELGVELLWDGPPDPSPKKQNEIIEGWITRGDVDVIAVAVENRSSISDVLREARKKGIKVVTWDADAEPDARDFLVNQATPEGIGETLMDEAARVLKGKGEFAIITASLTAANMIEWQKHIEARRKEKYPDITMPLDPLPCEDLQGKALEQATTILNAHKDVKLIMAICSPAVPGAAEAVKQANRNDVKVIGLGLPNDNKPYVKEGITDCVILWNTADLGYLTVHAAYNLKRDTLRPGDRWMQAGRLRNVEIQGDNILLGKPLIFTKKNIDDFDF